MHMTVKKKLAKTIAPRLANGRHRIPFGHGLPEDIKEGLRHIARRENKSMSWVLEQVIIDYFNLPRPKYVKTKKGKENG